MRRTAVAMILLSLPLGLVAGAAVSATSTLRPADSPATTSQPAGDDRLKAAFEALPEPERRAVQDALLWTGDFAGVVTGAFGPRSREALTTFARRTGVPLDTVLDAKTRARLLAAATSARAEVGFAPVADKAAGVSLSLPLKSLPRRVATEGGTHYASADGSIAVDTLSRPAGSGGLAEVFERMSASAGPRRVTYKLLKPDFFVVAGDIGERKFYTRFVLGMLGGQALIRGVTLAYPKTEAPRLDPVALAVAASFEPFPRPSSGMAGQDPPTPPVAPAAAPAPVFTITAIRVGPGLALTIWPGKACGEPSVEGNALRIRKGDAETGLVLFEVPDAAGAGPTLMPTAPAADMRLFAVMRREADRIEVAPAELAAGTEGFVVSAGLQDRADGVPVVDRQGRLAGLTGSPRRIPPSVQGTRVAADYPVVAATRLRVFLEGAGLKIGTAPDRTLTLADVASAWRPLLLRVVCRGSEPTR